MQRESTKAGLENAYLAWAVDELKEERKYFTTVQNSVFSVEKAGKVLNFYDTPGLRDFMSECISATMQADCAVIVMDLSMRKHLQEKVFTPTRDLAYLARSLGLNNVLVFLAKADLVVKNPEKVQEFSGKAQEILKEAGFKEGNIKVLAGSSLEKGVSNEIINFALETPKGLNEEVKPLRLLIDDCFKLVHGKFLGYCICGFILSGIISVGGKIRIDQAGVSGKVKEILKNDIKVKKAMAGDWINFTLTDFEGDFHKLRRSFILTSPDFPTSLYSDLRVRGITNDLKVPLLKKQELIMCIGSIRTQVTVLKILREIIGKSTKNKPRGLKGKTIGDIDIRCHNEVPIEKYKSLQKLGRIVLLHQNQVVFTGMVLEPCN